MKTTTIATTKGMLCIIMIFAFSHCQSNDNKYEVINHSDTCENNLFIGESSFMLLTEKNHLIGLDYGNDTFFYCQNISRPDSFFRFGTKGQGPDEYIHPFSIQYIDDNTIGVYDAMQKKYTETVLIPYTGSFKKKVVVVDKMSFSVLKTACNQYIGIGAYRDAMFTVYDSAGTQFKSFFEYPYKNSDEKKIKNEIRAMAYQGKIRTNLSRTKFVYAASSADIIHFYDIEEGDIRVIKKIENRFCNYIPEENNGAISAAKMPTNKNGCADLYATEKYVYYLYSGRTFAEYRLKFFEGDLLRIYDWNGNLLKEVKTDIPCKNICVSSDDKTMLAIAEIPEPTVIQFDLKNTLH
ncbi:MAG: TolB-like 6-bladed beta-propeller domain-containing protein [Tannerella sp.]|jgi:hypothetical protein|nr:TolB-like 6-bladed beta-propeller domain-containing protein [Tannerella sp.]